MDGIKQALGGFIFAHPLLSMVIGAAVTIVFIAWSMGLLRRR